MRGGGAVADRIAPGNGAARKVPVRGHTGGTRRSEAVRPHPHECFR